MITTSKLTDWAKALGSFLGDDERFQTGVGGNPNAVEAMIDRARSAKASIEAELKAMDHQALEDCMAATRLDPLVIERLTTALADLPDMASVTVLAGDLRKVLGLT